MLLLLLLLLLPLQLLVLMLLQLRLLLLQFAAQVKNLLFLARVEFLREAGCVVHCFQYTRGHIPILV